jgi:hypothetical protein
LAFPTTTCANPGEVTARQLLLAREGLETGHDLVTGIEDDREGALARRSGQQFALHPRMRPRRATILPATAEP